MPYTIDSYRVLEFRDEASARAFATRLAEYCASVAHGCPPDQGRVVVKIPTTHPHGVAHLYVSDGAVQAAIRGRVPLAPAIGRIGAALVHDCDLLYGHAGADGC